MFEPRHPRLSTALFLALLTTGACSAPEVMMKDTGGNGGDVGLGGAGGGGSSGFATDGPGSVFTLPDAEAAKDVDPSSDDDEPMCGVQNVKLQRRPAELLLILDRSGSMTEKVASGMSRWNEMIPALDETIKNTATVVAWGLKIFPVGDAVCSVADGVEVPVATDSYAAISARMKMETPEGQGTPTAAAVNKAVAYLNAAPSANSRFIVLATDGGPNCGAGRDDDNGADAVNATAAVAAAKAAGYPTFVVGIATLPAAGTVPQPGAIPSAHEILNGMADAGGQSRAGDVKYYSVESRTELSNALSLITGKVSSCTFPLDTAPPVPDNVRVKIDGVALDRDPAHKIGWDYSGDMKAIEVYGADCDGLKSEKTKDVVIVFGCPDVIIP